MARPDDSVLAALAVLGLGPDADRDQVSAAYRRLARTTHPDLSGAPDAAARFAVLAAAYQRANRIGRADEHGSPEPSPATAPPEPAMAPVPRFVRWSRPVFVAGPVHVEPPLPPDFHNGSASEER